MKATLTMLLISAGTALGVDKMITPWSFQPLKRPMVPPAQRADWPRDDIDRFVLARLQKDHATPNPDAPRATLLRRATLDLHGLLPSVDELDAFIRDPRKDDEAFAAVVDRLLKSPRFGERWARHWLDVVRFAESTGRSWNAPLTYAFRYRDWVIDSFNDDKPYTRFMAQQIAGDLLPAKSDNEKADNILGTAFLGLGSMDLQQGENEQFAMDLVDDQIDVTTRAFLGLTIACARCHDHKTDPVTQHDYYALAGMFYSTDTWAGTADRAHLGANLYVDPDRLVRLPSKSTKVANPSASSDGQNLFDDTPGAMSMTPQNGRYITRHSFDPQLAMGVSDGHARNCPIRIAGNPYDEGKTPHRGEWQIPKLPPMPKVEGKSSGRAELAQWLTTTTHPLTSRVMANRIWAHLFGKGIVATVDNFGITGEKPGNAELLDHLAVRFVTDGWSVKKLIRSIMLSRTYRMSSDGSNNAPATDAPWRMSARRIEVEVLRDALLQASGELQFDRPAGIQIAGNGGKGKDARTRSLLGTDSTYRTIYLPVLRDLLPEMHEIWDFPNPTQIRGQREVTTVPSQALFLLNNRFVDSCAAAIAERVAKQPEDERIAFAYRLLLSRDATADEIADAKAYLDDSADSWVTFIQAIIASAEFRYAL